MHDRVREYLCKQIDKGGTTIGLDVDKMSEYGDTALRVHKVLDLRKGEIEQVAIAKISEGKADLRALWLTAYGHSILSSLGMGTTCSLNDLDKVMDALTRLGFSVNVISRDLSMPTNITMSMRTYIWKIADRNALRR